MTWTTARGQVCKRAVDEADFWSVKSVHHSSYLGGRVRNRYRIRWGGLCMLSIVQP